MQVEKSSISIQLISDRDKHGKRAKVNISQSISFEEKSLSPILNLRIPKIHLQLLKVESFDRSRSLQSIRVLKNFKVTNIGGVTSRERERERERESGAA